MNPFFPLYLTVMNTSSYQSAAETVKETKKTGALMASPNPNLLLFSQASRAAGFGRKQLRTGKKCKVLDPQSLKQNFSHFKLLKPAQK